MPGETADRGSARKGNGRILRFLAIFLPSCIMARHGEDDNDDEEMISERPSPKSSWITKRQQRRVAPLSVTTAHDENSGHASETAQAQSKVATAKEENSGHASETAQVQSEVATAKDENSSQTSETAQVESEFATAQDVNPGHASETAQVQSEVATSMSCPVTTSLNSPNLKIPDFSERAKSLAFKDDDVKKKSKRRLFIALPRDIVPPHLWPLLPGQPDAPGGPCKSTSASKDDTTSWMSPEGFIPTPNANIECRQILNEIACDKCMPAFNNINQFKTDQAVDDAAAVAADNDYDDNGDGDSDDDDDCIIIGNKYQGPSVVSAKRNSQQRRGLY